MLRLLDNTRRIRYRPRGLALIVCAANCLTQGRALSAPEAAPSLRLDVVPVLSKLGCNQGACHGSQKGKGGFKLSLRGENPAADRIAIARDGIGRRVNRADPASSLLILKPSGQVPHEGGKLLATDSANHRTLLAWVASGCPDDSADARRIAKLSVAPAEKLSFGSLRQQLSVKATLTNGAVRDVTDLAVYEASEPARVQVSPAGSVVATEPTEVSVSARYANMRTASRLAFLVDRPPPTWPPFEVRRPLDRAVKDKLKSIRVAPSSLADDSIYLRRAFLATIGRLPTVDETRAFLADAKPSKRDRLADSLVNRLEFADFWALKFADLLRNEEKVVGPKGVELFRDWLVKCIRADMPMPDMAKALLATIGSTWQRPAANFHRTNRDPETAAEAAAQVFLGYRLQCAKCHNHPFDIWTQDDYYGLAAYFARVERTRVGPDQRRDKNDKHENVGDELITLKAKADFRHPIRNVAWSPKPLAIDGGRPARTSEVVRAGGGASPLDELATAIVADPQFERNFANRVWFHLFGRGIVDPPDDFRESNPPSNPALLAAIVEEFRSGGHRLKPLVAAILKSRTFQSASTANDSNRGDEINFARYPAHLLSAEVLYDSIAQVLADSEEAAAANQKGEVRAQRQPQNGQRRSRAVQIAGVKTDGRFLRVFGKPERLLTCECERYAQTSLAQAFQMINGPEIRAMVSEKKNRLGRLLDWKVPDPAVVEEIYLTAYCRYPSQTETAALVEYLARAKDRRAALEDIAWSVVNSKGFLLIE